MGRQFLISSTQDNSGEIICVMEFSWLMKIITSETARYYPNIHATERDNNILEDNSGKIIRVMELSWLMKIIISHIDEDNNIWDSIWNSSGINIRTKRRAGIIIRIHLEFIKRKWISVFILNESPDRAKEYSTISK
jgi:hypothetical protein